MSSLESKTFSTGIFRLVSGSPHEKQTKDSKGNPLLIKSGDNKGQPTQRFSFGVAVPKKPGLHWSQTEGFLQDIYATGHAQMGALAQREDFSWKVQDGDSVKINKSNRRNVDNEGWAGHWVVFFSSSYAPKCSDAAFNDIDGTAIKRGHFVRVAGSVVGNGDTGNPGVYVNHMRVMHAGIGPEITSGVDAKTAFAAPAAAPAGMSPVPQNAAQAAFAAPAPAAPAPPAPSAAPAPLPPPVAVAPAPSFIAPPVAPAAPTPPPPPVAGPVWKGPTGTTYEMYKAANWSDEQMRAGGLLA